MKSQSHSQGSLWRSPEPADDLPHLDSVTERLVRLETLAQQNRKEWATNQARLASVNAKLAIADSVTDALEILSRSLFTDQLQWIERQLTIALQEVLEQPIALKGEVQWKRDSAAVEFFILRDGHQEHIVKGQGGSVANTVSVGLRLFALMSLDPARHRRVLVLDEQDCWLRPDLVPRLVQIVHDASRALGFQVMMVSHHDVSLFNRLADKIYRFESSPNGATRIHCDERDSETDDEPT